ncbi:MAG: beta-propeller domain-containing protein [Propionibacteriaceae bacterium]|jgi:uncharacterized secreted protein with C-terminal beta-propeller domain|nr:beta-propeller domain-containing protein [Propionibacteriaceae bacterium]
MSDEIFDKMSAQMKPSDELLARLDAALAAESADAASAAAPSDVVSGESPLQAASGSTRPAVSRPTGAPKRKRRVWLPIASGVSALAVVVAGSFMIGPMLQQGAMESSAPQENAPAATQFPMDSTEAVATSAPPEVEPVASPTITASGPYAEVLGKIANMPSMSEYLNPAYSSAREQANTAPMPASAPEVATDTGVLEAGSYTGYTGTNTQVVGIDEGDIVKTDGKAIYVASGKQIKIVDPVGAATQVVATINTTDLLADADPAAGLISSQVLEMMVDDGKLIVFVTEYQPRTVEVGSENTTYVPYDATQTKAVIYDVSTPASPKYLASLGQSGAYSTTRLSEGVLYVVTSYSIDDPASIDPEDPSTFVPLTSDDDRKKLTPIGPDRISICPGEEIPVYTVATAIDVNSQKRLGEASVLGSPNNVYMSDANLYIASYRYHDVYTGVDTATQKEVDWDSLPKLGFKVENGTQLVRIRLNGGDLQVAAQGLVAGSLVDQFAMDEYDGYLRVATTIGGATGDSSNFTWKSQPALFVLDGDLKTVGSIEKLVSDESIQSVRFNGAVGYVVTFQQVDPLFAINLGNPKDPKVMDKLKVPGYSTYMHPWTDGKLLGLGYNADTNGNVSGMKLSMYDAANPYDLRELQTEKVKFDDSEALQDHRAVFVDPESGIVAFPAYSWSYTETTTNMSAVYLVYKYDDEAGFTQLGSFELPVANLSYVSTRAFRIESSFYVANRVEVDVFDYESLAEQHTVKLD